MVFGALLAFSPSPLQLGPRRINSRKVWRVRVRGGDEDLGIQEERVVFSEGVKEWGVGSGPIFTVDRNSEDGRLRVSVDEEEIVVRSGFQSMVSRRPCDSSERISKARRIAEEIEQGKLLPPESDPMFRFVGREELQQPVNFVMSSPPGHVSSTRNDLVATNFVGLMGGIGVALTSFLVNRWKEMEKDQPGEEKKKKKEKVASDGNPDDEDDEEKKLTKIRSMAREVELSEAARKKDDEKTVPEPLRYAAAARAELVKKQQNARRGEAKESEVITLARRLGEVRRLGDGELLPGKVPGMLVNGVEIPVASENSLNGSPRVHEEDQSSSPQARVDDETGAVSRGTMPRIITSYEEACEVLASRNMKSKKLTDARTSEDHKLVPDELKLEKESSGDPKLTKTEEVVKVEESSSTGSGEQDGWLRDDVLEILIRTRKNDLEGKDYFHGLPPDAKEILFKGLDEDLGEDEAEQFKAWVNQKTAAKALKAAAPPSEANPVLKPPRPRALGAKPGAAAASNKKKVWPKEFQRRYERETSPKMRKLLRDMGKDLDRWVPEEVLDADLKLFQQGPEGMRELLRRWITALKEEARQKGKPVGEVDEELSRYDKLQKRMEKHEALFGKQDLANKMSDYKPRKKDTLWWLDLRYVACIMVRNDEREMNPGLYSMNMAIDEEKETKMHVVAFEEQNDARNFCRLLVPELDKEGGSTGVAVIPFEPKELLNEVRSTKFEVTVVKKGQVELYAGKPLEEAEARIYEIGRDVYVQERLRERSCDINAALKEFERDL